MRQIAGLLILGMWLADLAHLYVGFSAWPAAALGWGAALLLGPAFAAVVGDMAAPVRENIDGEQAVVVAAAAVGRAHGRLEIPG